MNREQKIEISLRDQKSESICQSFRNNTIYIICKHTIESTMYARNISYYIQYIFETQFIHIRLWIGMGMGIWVYSSCGVIVLTQHFYPFIKKINENNNEYFTIVLNDVCIE